eukprot:1257013-Rhodomonas_salina.1
MQGQITAMQAVIAQLQADAVTSAAAVAAAQATAVAAQAAAAGGPAGGAPAAPIDLAAIAAAVAGARRPPDHSRDLDYFDSVSLDETPVPMRVEIYAHARRFRMRRFRFLELSHSFQRVFKFLRQSSVFRYKNRYTDSVTDFARLY